MQAYLLDIIPRLKRFSKLLDDQTRLQNQHWVVVDELKNSKVIYIFRDGKELLVSNNGKVEKGRWDILSNNSVLIDIGQVSLLYKIGFLDENVMALKLDNNDGYAMLANENRYNGELNTIERIADFLKKKYLDPSGGGPKPIDGKYSTWLDTNKGQIEIRSTLGIGYAYGDLVFLDGDPAPDGKYVYGWPAWASRIIVENGRLVNF